MLLRCPTRAHRHTVVVGKEAVEIGMRTTQQRVHGPEASLLRPVGVELSHDVDRGTHGNNAIEALCPLYRRRRRRESTQLHHTSSFGQRTPQVFSHRRADLTIVGTDIGRIFVGSRAAVEDDHRYSLLISTVDGGRDRDLSWRHDEQIDPLVHKAVDLIRLQPYVVVGRGDIEIHIIIV